MRNTSKIFLASIFIGSLLVSCNRQPLQVEANVTFLTDYQSNDGAISLTITGGKMPYSVQWSNGATGEEINNLPEGQYIAVVTDAKGRNVADTFMVEGLAYPVCIDNQGNNYKTTIVGNKVWMTEDIRLTVDLNGDSLKFYQNPDSAELGMLYTWEVAMAGSSDEGAQGVCPDGWHIPTNAEWKELAVYLTNDSVVENLINPFDHSYAGFYNGEFQNSGKSASYWSSSKAHDNVWKAYYHKSLKKSFVYYEKPTNAISVRCVKD